MSDELANVKSDLAALERAYGDAGGVLAADRDHCPCPFCGDRTGFSIRIGRESRKPQWQCHAKCGQERAGSIVDLLMKWQKLDSKAACRLAVEKYGNGQRQNAKTPRTGQSSQRTEGSGASAPAKAGTATHFQTAENAQQSPVLPAKKEGKLHQNPDLAVEAVLWGIRQKKDPRAEFAARWNYTDEKGLPVFTVARFNLASGKKEIVPIRRDGNGWRVGLGGWGMAGKLMPLYRLKEMTRALENHGQEKVEQGQEG